MSQSVSPPWGKPGAADAADVPDAMVDGVLTRRVLAFLVDGVLCSVILAFIWAFLLLFGVFTLGLGFALFGLLPAIPFLYNWLSVCSRLSATPGQRLQGLIVVRRADLGRPTPLEGLIWTAGFVVTLSLGVVWFAAALVTLHHRTLHDVVSGLLVVRRKSLTARPALWDAPRRGPGFAEYV